MKSLLLLLLSIALIWVGCGGSSYVTQDTYLAHQGFIELSKGNYSLAEANLLVSLDIKPNNPYSLLNLGAVYQDTGRTWQAVEMYEKILELNPEQSAIQSNKERYKGKSLVEIAKENLKSLAVNDAAKGSIIGPFDIGESVVEISDMKTLFSASKDHLPGLSDTAAINASALYAEGKQESIALTLSDGPSAIGISAIGASAGTPGGGSGDGGSDGGGSGDGGSDGGGSGDGGSDGGGSGDGGSDGGGSGDGGSDGGGSGDGGSDGGGSGDGGSDGGGSGDGGSGGGGSGDGGSGGGGSGDGGSGGGGSGDGGSDGGGTGSGGGNSGGHGGGNSGGHGGVNSGGHGGGNSGGHGGGNSGGHGGGHGGSKK